MSSPRLLLLSSVYFIRPSIWGFNKASVGPITISTFLLQQKVKKGSEIIFLPFGLSTRNWDDCEKRVQSCLRQFIVHSIHKEGLIDYTKAIEDAKAIIVDGEYTFTLLHHLRKYGLIEPIRRRVLNDNVPYIGLAAGASVAAPDILTCADIGSSKISAINDNALNLVPYNVNPDYTNMEVQPISFTEECAYGSAKQRITKLRRPVVAINEGVGIYVESGKHWIIGTHEEYLARIWFPNKSRPEGCEFKDLLYGDDISPLIS